jgi:peroxiredoxin
MIRKLIATLNRHGGSILLVATMTASLGVNVYLAERVKASMIVHQAGTAVGVSLASIPVVQADGTKTDISVNDGRWSVVYVMSPSCIWCRRNLANINALSAASQKRYRFIGLSVTADKLAEYVKAGYMPFTPLAVDTNRQPKQLDIAGTPSTLVIDPSGTVKKVWNGAYQGDTQNEIEQFFHVKLPGLKDL